MIPEYEELELTLAWRHGTGGLNPFFDALKQGRILGSRCTTCGHTSVPPRVNCAADGSEMKVLELPPTAAVLHITEGAASGLLDNRGDQQTFALVQITGSDNCILARIDTAAGRPNSGHKVKLAMASYSGGHPVQLLVFIAEDRDPQSSAK